MRTNFLSNIVLLLVMPLFLARFGILDTNSSIRSLSVCEIDGTESMAEGINSDRGFYTPRCIRYSVTGNVPVNYDRKLMHLRLDLSKFSGSCNGEKDKLLTGNMLYAFEKTLSYLEKKGYSAVIRFAYDPWYSGQEVYEPPLEIIMKHQEQVAAVIAEHQNAVLGVETGLIGKWGELHGTAMCTPDNIAAIINQWVDVLPETVPVLVRTPSQYTWAKGINISEIDLDINEEGDRFYRVGMYDDGYMGTWNDTGTYVDREKEVSWLSKQIKHSVFGGEMIGAAGILEGESIAAFLEKEAFRTHTTYLNSEWMYSIFATMQNEAYNGKDPLYNGEAGVYPVQTGYDYLRNHLGYRLVLKDASITKEVSVYDKLLLNAEIENVGFANIVKPKKVFIILKGEDTYKIPVTDRILTVGEYVYNSDPTKWYSETKTSFRCYINLPDFIVPGSYKVYLKVAYDIKDDSGYSDYPVQFANADENIWDNELGANYVDEIEVVDFNI